MDLHEGLFFTTREEEMVRIAIGIMVIGMARLASGAQIDNGIPHAPQVTLEESKGAVIEKTVPVGPIKVQVVWSKKTAQPVIAITIDDCYSGALLEKAHEVAIRNDVKFTFFPTGNAVSQYPKMWKEIYAFGHEIELHTQSHTQMTKMSEEGQYDAYRKNIETLRSVLGEAVTFSYVRPPCGRGVFGYEKSGCMPSYRRAVERLGIYNGVPIDIAMWSGDSLFIGGKQSSGEEVQRYFRTTLSPGMIYLYHTRKADVGQLEEMVQYAKSKGYRLVTLKELLVDT